MHSSPDRLVGPQIYHSYSARPWRCVFGVAYVALLAAAQAGCVTWHPVPRGSSPLHIAAREPAKRPQASTRPNATTAPRSRLSISSCTILRSKVHVDEPPPGAKVPYVTTLAGRGRAEDGRRYLAVVYDLRRRRFHPQEASVTFSRTGAWYVPIHVGAPFGSHGERFHVYLVALDQAAGDAIGAYLRQARADGTRRGLERLPPTARRLQCTTVVRR